MKHSGEERRIMAEILKACGSLPGVILWRNTVGYDKERKIHYGLCVGSADLVGLVDGQFIGLEVKSATGSPTPEQQDWIAAVNAFGGTAAIVRSAAAAMAVIEDARRAVIRSGAGAGNVEPDPYGPNRASQPGWVRIGRWCSARRRSLWARHFDDGTVEICGGREGDDLLIRAGKGAVSEIADMGIYIADMADDEGEGSSCHEELEP